MTHKITIAILFLFFTVSCKSNGQKNVADNARKISLPAPEELPYDYSYSAKIDNITNINDFLKAEHITPSDPATNNLFSKGTILGSRKEKYGHPYLKNAFLFKRLPDISNYKILLFTYWDKQTDYKLPTIELQIFDSDWNISDKMIVVDGTNYECSWNRLFKLSKNYDLEITDRDICWDMASNTKLSDTKKTTFYQITNNGKITERKAINTALIDLSNWIGTYKLTLNKNSGDSRDEQDITLTIKNDSVIYEEGGYQLYNKYLLSPTDSNGALSLKYINTLEGGSAVINRENNFGTIKKQNNDYLFNCPYLDVRTDQKRQQLVFKKLKQ